METNAKHSLIRSLFSSATRLYIALHACPCGFYGDPLKPCTCSPGTVTKYQKRISGPLLDRIEIHIEVPRVEYDQLSDQRLGEPSSVIQKRVEVARQLQREHFIVGAKHSVESQPEAEALNPNASPLHATLKLARTIADLAGSVSIQLSCRLVATMG